jgi:O-antigen ligase
MSFMKICFKNTAQHSTNPLFIRTLLALHEIRELYPDKPTLATEAIGIWMEWYFNAFQTIKEHPIFGTGTGSFLTIYQKGVKGKRNRSDDAGCLYDGIPVTGQ